MAKVLKGPWAQRESRYALWHQLWPDLPVPPGEDMERVIAELVGEVRALASYLGHEVARDQTAWLLGFVGQAGLEWPPACPGDYRAIFEGLKAKKLQLQGERRKAEGITAAQRRMIWGMVHSPQHPTVNEDLVYQIIEAEFPKARRRKRGRKAEPSMSRLTQSEARRLIDALKHPARAGRRRRA